MAVLPKRMVEETVRARRTELCCECGRGIWIGEVHVRSRGEWEVVKVYRTCGRCWRLRRLAVIKYGFERADGAPAFGRLREWIMRSRARA